MSLRARTLTALVALVMIGAGALPPLAFATPLRMDQQADAFGRLIAEKDAAIARQDWPAAERLLRSLLDLALTRLDRQSLTVGQIYVGLGDAVYSQSRRQEAAGYYRQGLEIYRAVDADPFEIEYAAFNLGNLLATDAEYDEAESVMREAIDIRLTELGPDHIDTANGMRDLSSVILRAGRPAEAETFAAAAVAVFRTHPQGARWIPAALLHLAYAQSAQGRTAEALASAEEAVALMAAVPDTADADVADSLSILGGFLLDQGRYREAEPLARRALALHRQIAGPNAPALVHPMTSLAGALQGQARLLRPAVVERQGDRALDPVRDAEALRLLGESEALLRRMLVIQETAFGPDHPATVEASMRLAAVLFDLYRLDEAETLQRRALDRYSASVGASHPFTSLLVLSLANTVRAQGRWDDAEPLYRRAIEIRRRAGLYDHADTSAMVNNLGATLLFLDRAEEGMPLVDEAMAMKVRAYCSGTFDGRAATCSGHPDFAPSVAGVAAARFAVENRPWAGLRLSAGAEDMTLARTRTRYVHDPDARAEFGRQIYTHRQFVSQAWGAATPADAEAISADLRGFYWPSRAASD